METSARAEPTLERVPRHVGIIMDGNGRWAKQRGLPRTAGHEAGYDNLHRLLPSVIDLGIEILTIYAFSTENWRRPAIEVRALLALLERAIGQEVDELDEQGVRIRHLGREQGIEGRLLAEIRRAEQRTAHNDRLLLNIAFNYGGRAEIVDAVRSIVAEGLPPEEITEETISNHLSTSGLPDPDLIIRTGGEMRLSNFLIWQASYAEIYSTSTLWPDFDRDALYCALLEYERRERRFGGIEPAP